MANKIRRYLSLVILVGALLPLAASLCWSAQQPAGQEQRFTVLHASRLTGPSIEMTAAEANCGIAGSGDDATMKCKPIGVTAKSVFHYNAALVVDAQGTAYIIACRIALVTNLWCKSLGNERSIRGTLGNGHLLVSEGSGEKGNTYLVLGFRSIGPVTVSQPAPPANAKKASAAAPPPPSVPAAPVAMPSANSNTAAAKPEPLSSDASAACISNAGACVAFVSEPQGADIFVDGKFVGNTPSTLTLTPGSHAIRMESAQRKPWTRTFDASAGSKITIRGTLEALPPQK